jgi:hypothetical protein
MKPAEAGFHTVVDSAAVANGTARDALIDVVRGSAAASCPTGMLLSGLQRRQWHCIIAVLRAPGR